MHVCFIGILRPLSSYGDCQDLHFLLFLDKHCRLCILITAMQASGLYISISFATLIRVRMARICRIIVHKKERA